jgi:uncharacterized protein (TIGR00297 family)
MGSWLTPAGVAAATAVGAATVVGAGWRGLVLLAVFFVSSSALTRGGGRRTARQVFANGGVAGVAALLSLLGRWGLPAFAGALAAAAADTWATEIGGRSAATPRLVTTAEPVSPGTSGGVTWLGSAGGVAGAALLAATAAWLGLVPVPLAAWVALAGVAGGFADSLLGATLQARFRCPACGRDGETSPCPCGAAPTPASGLPWLTNDAVNLACTLVGAALGTLPAALGTTGLR